MEQGQNRSKAREIAELRYWFRWHLVIYIVVNIGFVALWYFTGPFTGTLTFFWPVLTIILWGVFGVGAHYFIAYRGRPGKEWIARETEKILKEE